MKSLRYKQVGEFKILDKFDQLPIDPAMTQIYNRAALEKSPEQAAVNQKVAEKHSLDKARRKTLNKSMRAKYLIDNGLEAAEEINSKEKRKLFLLSVQQAPAIFAEAAKNLKIQDALGLVCVDDINKLSAEFEEKRRRLVMENPIFIHPRRNEIELTTEKYKELNAVFDELKNEQIVLDITFEDKVVLEEAGKAPVKAPFAVLLGYEKIADWRGCQWFWKDGGAWEKSAVIDEMGANTGVPLTAIEKRELTSEQADEIRIQRLSAEEREAEKESTLHSILSRAAMMKSELEIQEDGEALAKSQAWYQEQSAIIKEKYNAE